MGYFESEFESLLERLGTSTYKLALSVGEDPSRIDKVLLKKKPVTFEKRLETLKKIAESPILQDVDFVTLAGWLARDYLPEEVFVTALKKQADKRGFKEIE